MRTVTSAESVAGAAGVAPSGYVYSFNGPQSLFADTIRSMRSLVVAHQLGAIADEAPDEAALVGDDHGFEISRGLFHSSVNHGDGVLA